MIFREQVDVPHAVNMNALLGFGAWTQDVALGVAPSSWITRWAVRFLRRGYKQFLACELTPEMPTAPELCPDCDHESPCGYHLAHGWRFH